MKFISEPGGIFELNQAESIAEPAQQDSFGMILVDTSWTILYVDDFAAKAINSSGTGPFVSQDIRAIVAPHLAELIQNAGMQCKSSGLPVVARVFDPPVNGFLKVHFSPAPTGLLVTIEEEATERPEEPGGQDQEQAATPTEQWISNSQEVVADWVWNHTTHTFELSERLSHLLGWTKQDGPVILDRLISQVHPNDLQHIFSRIKSSGVKTVHFCDDLRMVRAHDGRLIWVRTQGSWKKNASGIIEEASGVCQDITDAVPSEEIIRISEERFRMFSESFRIAFAYLDRDLRVQYHFPRGTEWLIGLRRPVAGRPLPDLLNPDIFEKMAGSINKVLQGQSTSFELEIPVTEGESYWIDIRLIPHPLETEIIGFYAFLRDKTDLKRVEIALMKSESQARYQLAEITTYFESAPVGLCIIDTGLNYIRINKALAEINEHPIEAHTGKSIFEMIPGIAPQVAEMVQRVIRTGAPLLDVEIAGATRSGESRIWLESFYPMRSADGIIDRVNIVVRDVTKERRILRDLVESESRYSALFENNHSVMMLIDPEKEVIVDVNSAACRFYGYTRKELTGKHIGEINTLTQKEIVEQMDRARDEKRKRFDFRHRLAGGEIRDVEVFSGPIVVNGKSLLYSIVHDVSERIRAEEALKASEERFGKAFRLSPIALSLSDRFTQTYVDVNDSFSELVGLPRTEIIGKNVAEVGIWNVAERSIVVNTLAGSGEVRNLEHTFLDRLGHIRTVIFSSEIITSGDKEHVLDTIEDITERKHAEAQLFDNQRRLKMANANLENRVEERTRELSRVVTILESRNRELQSFAYIASHDLQEPLRKVQTLTSLLRTDFLGDLNEEALGLMRRIENAAQRMSQMLSDVLAFSRVATHQQPYQLVDLRHILTEVLTDLDLAISETAAVVHIDVDLQIEADRNQIRQLFNHLLLNAIKFRCEDRPLVLTIRGEIDPNMTERTCTLIFEDNGIGFDQRYAERIFEPFQRLHGRSAFPGSGMGLSICRRIVERHKGKISVESSPGVGSRFFISIPVVQGSVHN